MGNRAIVKPVDKNYGVYLHWNGGINSVTGFLEYCKLKQYRPFGCAGSDGYGIARFCQVVGNFFGGGLSIGIEDLDPYKDDYGWSLDNGIYIIDGWDIVDHKGDEPIEDKYDLQKFILSVDKAQPEKEQLGEDYIFADVVKPEDIKIGDTVFIYGGEIGGVTEFQVSGFTDSNIPYIDRYSSGDNDYKRWSSNYITAPVRVKHK